MLDVVGVVIHHVEDDADAGIVKRLHHLLEFADAHFRGIRIGGVASLGHVVVHRVVAPVVLVVAEARLIHRAVVVAREDMDGIDAQFLEVADGPGLGEGEELSLIAGIGAGDGEVAVVHLVDDEIGRRLGDGMAILCPTFGIGGTEVDDGAPLAVDSYGLGKDTRTLAEAHVEGVELSHQIASDISLPLLVGSALHLDGLDGFASLTIAIETEGDALGIVGGKEYELGLLRGIVHLVEMKVVCCR